MKMKNNAEVKIERIPPKFSTMRFRFSTHYACVWCSFRRCAIRFRDFTSWFYHSLQNWCLDQTRNFQHFFGGNPLKFNFRAMVVTVCSMKKSEKPADIRFSKSPVKISGLVESSIAKSDTKVRRYLSVKVTFMRYHTKVRRYKEKGSVAAVF